MYTMIDIRINKGYIVYSRQDAKEESRVNLSFQEKSIAGSVAATVLVYGNYFAESILGWQSRTPDENAAGRLLGTIGLLVVIEVVYQIVIAVVDQPSPKDERDRLVDGKANRNAYAILVLGLALLITCVLIVDGVSSPEWVPVALTPFLLAQAMLASLVAAEVVKGVSQLYYYRAGF